MMMIAKCIICVLALAASTVTSQTSNPPFVRSLGSGHHRHHQPHQRHTIHQRASSSSTVLKIRGGRSAPSKTLPPPTSGGTATIPTEVFNLVKAIVGVGVLSLPAGIAAFGSARSAVLPAVALIAVIGALSGFGFSIIGRVCAYTGATSYREAWERSVGPSTGWIPAWSATMKTSLACLAFSMVLADTFSILLGKDRKMVLLGLTGVVLLPLCWMKDLASLAPFSLLGVIGMAFTGLAMTIRYLDGSYDNSAVSTSTKSLLSTVPPNLRPSFGTDGWQSVFTPKSLILVCMLSTAYMAHFNAPKFYLELQNNTLQRYNTVVAISFAISIVLIASIASVGYLTFGSNCGGLVLNNYATKDALMAGSRVAVAVALVFSYPLAFQGCRDGIIDMLGVDEERRKKAGFVNGVTVALLGVITLFAALLTDVSFVLAFGGGEL